MKNKLSIFLLCVIFLLCIGIVLLSCKLCVLSDRESITKNDSQATNSEKLLDVKTLCQYPELLTGCETVSATMVLNYYGIDITASEFATDILNTSDEFVKVSDKVYGPDPNEFFVGNPFEQYGYGCYAPAIEKAINDSNLDCKAEVITDKTLDELCSEYISKNEPLLVWVTQRMQELKESQSWYLSDDTLFTWMSGEHCVVLIGYNEKYYFFNDPSTGGMLAYEKEISQQRFEDMGSQALRIIAE